MTSYSQRITFAVSTYGFEKLTNWFNVDNVLIDCGIWMKNNNSWKERPVNILFTVERPFSVSAKHVMLQQKNQSTTAHRAYYCNED